MNIRRTDAEVEAPILDQLMQSVHSLEKILMLRHIEERKRWECQGEMVG